MSTPDAIPQATTDGLGPRGRRTLYATAAAIVAAAALILVLMGTANDESADPGSNPVAAENSNVAAPSGVTLQSYSVALPSCCYPLPATAP